MPASKITYGDKSTGQASAFPANQKWRSDDANEVKDVINSHADDIDTLNAASGTAAGTSFDNVQSGISATNVQAAFDETLSYNKKVIRAVSDLPAPVANVITLSTNNVIYLFEGIVDLGTNRLVIAANDVLLTGLNRNVDGFSSNTAGDIVTATTRNISMSNMYITSVTATRFFNFSTVSSNNCFFDRVTFRGNGANDCLLTSGFRELVFNFCIFEFFLDCIKITGTGEALLIEDCLFEDQNDIAIDLDVSVHDSITISNNTIIMTAATTFLNVAVSGANIASGGEGTITDNKIQNAAGGTPIVGYSPLDLLWKVSGNNGIITSDRLTPTGWGYYVDGETAPATQVVPSSPPLKLEIDGLGGTSNEDYLPKVVRASGTLFDTTLDKITPITEGDSYDIRLQVGINGTSGGAANLTLVLDIGATPDGTGGAGSIIVASDTKTVKGVGTPVILSFPIFSLGTFISNGGTFFLSSDTGTVTIDSRELLIVRTASGAS